MRMRNFNGMNLPKSRLCFIDHNICDGQRSQWCKTAGVGGIDGQRSEVQWSPIIMGAHASTQLSRARRMVRCQKVRESSTESSIRCIIITQPGQFQKNKSLVTKTINVKLHFSDLMTADSSASLRECFTQTAARPWWTGSPQLGSPVAQATVPWGMHAPSCTLLATPFYFR